MSRKSPRLAMNTMTLAEPARRSPRLAKLQPITLRRSDRIAQKARAEDGKAYRRSDRIAQAKAAAQAEQAARAETAAARAEAQLRRSVRINKPSDGNTVLRWQAFVKEILAENTVEDSEYESDYEESDYDYEVYKN